MLGRLTPIFVVGAAHSGTTIIYNMLAMHRDVAWFSQYSQRHGTIPNRFALPFYALINRKLRTLCAHDWRKRYGSSIRDYVIPKPMERSKIWDYIIAPMTGDQPSPEEFIRRMQVIFMRECKDWGTTNLLVKCLALNRYIELLHLAYPHAKFFHIVRDGRAVAFSLREKLVRKGESTTDGLREAAKYWVEVLNSVSQSKGSLHLLDVKYEDFCMNVHDTLREMLQFANLNLQRFPFERCPQTLEITNSKWLKAASQEELDLLIDLEKEHLIKYGYL